MSTTLPKKIYLEYRMKDLFKTGAALLFFLTFSISLMAQLKFEQAVHYSMENGLPSNSVRVVIKGPGGFMWVGTANGLCRFDGTYFKIYQNDPQDSTSILDSRVISLAVDEQYLWVGTHIGLSRMDLRSEKFTHYQFSTSGKIDYRNTEGIQQIRTLFIDRKGDVWVGTRTFGVGRYLPEVDDFRMYSVDNEEVLRFFASLKSVNSILSIEEHRTNDSIIWAGTTTGLLEINKYKDTLRWLHFEDEEKRGVPNPNGFRRIYHHTDGLLYAGSWGENTLKIYDPEKESITALPLADGPWKPPTQIAVSRILEKSENEIWITGYTGMISYDTKKQEPTFWRANRIRDNAVFGAEFIDDQNRAWKASGIGLFLFDPVVQQFEPFTYDNDHIKEWELAYRMIQHTDEKTITIFTNSGRQLYHIDKTTGERQNTFFPVEYLDKSERVRNRDLSIATDGRYWVTTNKNMYIFDPKTHEFGEMPPLPLDTLGSLRDLLWDSKGRLWVSGTKGRILRWDPQSGQSIILEEEIQLEAPELHTSSFRRFFEDSKGHIWFRRTDGYSVYLPEKNSFLDFSYPKNADDNIRTIQCFAEDKHGRVWINGRRGNVAFAEAAHPEKGMVRVIDLKEKYGLVHVLHVQADGQGDVWCIGNSMLVKITADDLQDTGYSYQYGIGNKSFHYFNVLPTGELAFGGSNRFWLAKPEDLQPNTELPKPYVSGIEVLQQPFPTDTTTSRLQNLDLKAHQNFFSLEFSAQGYTLGEKTQFRYRLKGFTDEWTNTGNRRFAGFTNVPGGNYTFQLQAANNEGVWNPQTTELSIFVATPWWATWWFRLAVLWFLGAIAFGAYRYKTTQIRKEAKLRADYEIKLADVEMTALRAQMNPHFLFNCLNSIESFIIRNETKKASEYLSSFARLIRLILQNSRSNLVNLKDELEAVELYMEMESMRFQDKFQYEIKVDKEVDVNNIDIPPMLMQPYIENAIWHGLMYKEDRSNGKVILTVTKEAADDGSKLHCSIEDNGIGREKAEQLKAKRPNRGKKSVGMRITKDRINMINKLYESDTSLKIIDLKDDTGEACGTRIELDIPI